ncbi:MAG: NADH-quinone oxidoreductase subunit N [Candidatus Kapaibacterium sp.]|jgi:NADH-quinone oxidoreductase subunit N
MLQELLLASPLSVLSLLSVICIVVDALTPKSERLTFMFAGFSMLISMVLAMATFGAHGTVFQGMITVGGYASFFDVVFCMAGILTLFAARPYILRENIEHDEFYSLTLFAVAGMSVIAHAHNLLMTFIGIEIMSVCFYVLAGYFRSNERSTESALKYFLLGAFATGFLVFGMSFVYGATGSLDYSVIREHVQAGALNFPRLLALGTGLIVVGLGFKVAVVPFHQWVPDVYEGSPTVVTAFMSTAGKAASLCALLPLIAVVVPQGHHGPLQGALAVLSALTMLVGNITAVVQTNVKRMLAYSSVAHAGYLLIGFVAMNERGGTGIVYYAVAYMFMQMGAFIVVSLVETSNNGRLQLSDYAGLSKHHPVLAALMALFMFSLAGIPPMAGFFGKYYLFIAAVEAGYTWLTVVAVISSMISVYFYIGLVVLMYFKDPVSDTVEAREGSTAGLTLFVCTTFVLLLGFFPGVLASLSSFILR